MKRRLIQWIALAVLAAGAFLSGWHLKAKDGESELRYWSVVTNILGQVYDGDTIQDVIVNLPVKAIPMEGSEYPVQIWPGIYQDEETVWAQVDLRLKGIQAPEKRVSTRLPEEEREELKAIAAASEQYLEELLKKSLFPGLVIIDRPAYGKYVGRLVADVKIPVLVSEDGSPVHWMDAEGGEVYRELSLSEAMLDADHAEPYDD